MGWLKKLVQKTVIGGALDLTGKLLGISNSSLFNGPDTSAAEKAAADAKAAAEAQQIAANQAAEQEKLALANMQANSLALSNANSDNVSSVLSNIVAGGTADAVDSTKKKRLQTQTLASTLGINI